jgi:hypothetical protein
MCSIFNIFNNKKKEIKLSLIEKKKKEDRSYLEFSYNNIEYLAFYTNSGSSGTSIYNKKTEEYITRISINPLYEYDMKKYQIKSKDDFINNFLIPELKEYYRLKDISNTFKN